MYKIGELEMVQPAYEAGFQWIEANGYAYLDGEYVREVYLKAGYELADQANIVELQIPITV